MKHIPSLSVRWLFALHLGAALGPLFGQSAASESRYYYAIENLENDQVVRRGTTTDIGIPQGDLILAPDTRFREWLFQVDNGFVGFTDFRTPTSGLQFTIPAISPGPPLTPDTDGDGLSDDAEFIVGTAPARRDTDTDGISDGTEVTNATNPLDGLPVTIGIIAATDTPGTAVDVCALNDIAVVANREAGVSVLNVAGANPIRIVEVDTPGIAQRVACFGNLVSVADGAAGLTVIDMTDPPAARIIHQVSLGPPAEAVNASGGIAFVGLVSGELVSVDLASGFVLARRQLGSAVQDMVLAEDHMLVATSSTLFILNPYELDLPLIGSVPASGGLRLVAGNGEAFITLSSGFDAYSYASPAQPALVRQNRPGQADWRQLAMNGSGIGIGAVAGFPIPPDIELYDVPSAEMPAQFRTRLSTPGDARSVSIYNGRAYVADGAAGLQVINYLASDTGTTRPSITLSSNFPLSSATTGTIQAGKPVRLTAAVTDDVQVRSVEFHVDGVRAVTDGTFPFEYRFLAPRLSSASTSFTVKAKATDTGGNFAWSDEVTVTVTPDSTPPRVVGMRPQASGIIPPGNDTFFIIFSEPMDESGLTAGNISITSAGPDNRFGTLDDLLRTDAALTYREIINSAAIAFREPLGLGVYRGTVTTGVTDAAGNALAAAHTWTFAILNSGADDDEDGDDLTNAEELARGLNPLAADSDGDGWIDSTEVADNTDPLDVASRPRHTVIARPPVLIDLPSPESFGTAGSPAVYARPPLMLLLPSPEMDGRAGAPAFLARPPLLLDLPSSDSAGGGAGLFLAQPPIEIRILKE